MSGERRKTTGAMPGPVTLLLTLFFALSLSWALGLRRRWRRLRASRPPAPLPVDFPVTLQRVQEAHRRIRKRVHRTPVLTSRYFDSLFDPLPGPAAQRARPGRRLHFKCEAFQRTGSFKIRGAMNAAMLTPSGVSLVTHSSGNHAQALALAAQETGREAHVIMPNNAPAVKRDAVAGYGAEITLCEPTTAARAATAERVRQTVGGVFVHPSNDPDVIAGQGTVGLELLEQVSDLDCVVVPVGGGGLLSGIAVALKTLRPELVVVAAEPENARDAYVSKATHELQDHLPGQPATVADGLKTTLGANTWPVVRDLVDSVITVAELDIVAHTALVWRRLKVCIEPSAAVGVAAVLSDEFDQQYGQCQNVGVILCGGNVDVKRMASLFL